MSQDVPISKRIWIWTWVCRWRFLDSTSDDGFERTENVGANSVQAHALKVTQEGVAAIFVVHVSACVWWDRVGAC